MFTTKISIAKSAVFTLVAYGIQNVIKNQLEEHTDIDTDRIAVQIGTGAAAYMIANKLEPVTDKAVDLTVAGAQNILSRKQTETPAA